MNKARNQRTGDLRSEYRKSDFPEGLVRGKYAPPTAGTKVVRLDPEIAAAFPTSDAVNKALGGLLRKAGKAAPAKELAARSHARSKRVTR
jgi:hypothetical protein